MRALRGLFCAVALVATLAPGARADEYTKQTFLTFSGAVQLPGITLPAGTYQFRLADPESGRRVLQVWDKDGSKLLTTLLTIPDQRMTPTDNPVVMFGERPSGQPQAIRAWFYPNESYGQEFVYPKDQAMKIARDTHNAVLSYDNDAKDEAAFKSAKVDRIDENGKVSDAESTTAANTASNTAPSASTTTASSASTTTADHSAQSNSAAQPAQTASASTGSAAMPSANRSSASAAVGTSGSTVGNTTSEANRDNTNVNDRVVGTSGAVNNANSANRTAQAAAGANAAAPRAAQSNTAGSAPARELPRTASSTLLVQLLAALSLAAAVMLRVFRTRAAESR